MDPQNLGGQVRSVELYDLQNDPDEMNDLAQTHAAVPHRERLMRALKDWTERTDDPAVRF